MSIGKQAYEEIAQIAQLALQDDAVKFYDKETNAAGGRLRKHLKAIADIVRAEKKNILEVRNGRSKK
jgi:hypothetical protein